LLLEERGVGGDCAATHKKPAGIAATGLVLAVGGLALQVRQVSAVDFEIFVSQ
jgi:hypothetical protein